MDFITIPIGYILKFFSNICGNSYILAILLFAILTELIMALVFGIRQQKNSIKQARLRPKEAAIRKKYAGRDDKPTQQKMTQEIQELYQKEGYNPMGGCLPLFLQSRNRPYKTRNQSCSSLPSHRRGFPNQYW